MTTPIPEEARPAAADLIDRLKEAAAGTYGDGDDDWHPCLRDDLADVEHEVRSSGGGCGQRIVAVFEDATRAARIDELRHWSSRFYEMAQNVNSDGASSSYKVCAAYLYDASNKLETREARR